MDNIFFDKSGLENKSDVVTAIGEYPGFVEYNILSLVNGAIKPEYLANHVLKATELGLMFGWKWEATNPITGIIIRLEREFVYYTCHYIQYNQVEMHMI